MRAQMIQCECFATGFDIDLHVPPGAPPQGLESAVLAAIGQHNIVKTDGVPSCYVVAVPLLELRVVQRLGIGKDDARAAATTECQLRIRGGQRLAVQQHLRGGMRWDGEARCGNPEAGASARPARTMPPGLSSVVRHLRQGIGQQAPWNIRDVMLRRRPACIGTVILSHRGTRLQPMQ